MKIPFRDDRAAPSSPSASPARARRTGAPVSGLLRRLLERWSRAAILPGAGEVRLPGLAAPVTVVFDEHDVPHIRAESDADAFRAQGYCHARDRLFQMDLGRRLLRGRLSEAIGDRPLGATVGLASVAGGVTASRLDHLMRVLGLEASAWRAWKVCAGATRAALLAYAEGINGALARLRHRPLEHRLLLLRIAPWSPLDSILLAKGLDLALSYKWRAGPLFAAIADALESGGALLDQLLGAYPAPASAGASAPRPPPAPAGVAAGAPLAGSNAWLVGAGRSASGKPLLACDPHLALGLPGLWHLASVEGAAYRAVGACLPGVPGVIIGRTPNLAWGVTNAMLDDADLWREELDRTGTRYRVDGAWRPLGVEIEEIRVRGGRRRTILVRRTHRGPLVSDALSGDRGPAWSIRMLLHEPGSAIDAFLALGRSRRVAEALAATAGLPSPAVHLFVADAEGAAAYRWLGRVPLRGHVVHPLLPRDGTTSASDWRGFAPCAALPGLEVPADGVAINANDGRLTAGSRLYLSCFWEPEHRAERIADALGERRGLSAEDLDALQLDAFHGGAEAFRRTVLAPSAEAVARARPELAPLLERILGWRGDCSADARGALPAHLLYQHLVRRTFGPHLGEDLLRPWMDLINAVDAPLLAAFDRPDSAWAPPRERAALVGRALADVAEDLRRHGLDPDAPWGRLHTVTLRHPLGGAAPLARTFNRGPYAVAGGPFAVCSGQYAHSRPGPVQVGQTYRQVVDLADPESARMVSAGGQSGHVGSPHYDDLTALWLAGRTLPMRLGLAAGRRLILAPA